MKLVLSDGGKSSSPSGKYQEPQVEGGGKLEYGNMHEENR